MAQSNIQHIVDLINTDIVAGHYAKINANGVAVLGERKELTMPVIYKGYGKYDNLTFNDSKNLSIYHRFLSISEDEDQESGYGCDPIIEQSYSMKLVAFGNQRQINDASIDINYKVADEIGNLLARRLKKVDLRNIKAYSGSVEISTRNHNVKEVFETELVNTAFKIKPESLLFSIDYTVNLKMLKSCKDLSCEITAPLIDISNLDCDNLTDEDFGIQNNQIADCFEALTDNGNFVF